MAARAICQCSKVVKQQSELSWLHIGPFNITDRRAKVSEQLIGAWFNIPQGRTNGRLRDGWHRLERSGLTETPWLWDSSGLWTHGHFALGFMTDAKQVITGYTQLRMRRSGRKETTTSTSTVQGSVTPYVKSFVLPSWTIELVLFY